MALKRRLFGIVGVAATIGLLVTATAPRAEEKFRLGVLMLGTPSAHTPDMAAFVEELARRGLVEGRNLLVERRYAEKFGEQVDLAVQELVALKPDALFTACGFRCAQAAKRYTTTIPIVFDGAGQPIAQGLTEDLARPTGNLTGTALFGGDLDFKRFEILREAADKASSFAMLQSPLDESVRSFFTKRLAAFAKAHRVRSQLFEVSGPSELPTTFERMARDRVDALVVASSPLVNLYCADIAALAAKYRLPTIGDSETCINAGLLLVYTPDFAEIYRHAAEQVYRVLMGAKPADLPIVQPSRFKLVVNLKVARTLGLTLPNTLLLRADRLIE
jgi:putative tryptophan/tyrosine transport system substrate-binding protein